MELQITFRHMTSSDGLSAHIRGCADDLEKKSIDLRSCRVVVEEPHQRQGKPFHVKLIAEVRGQELVAEHTDVNAYLAATEAFNALERQLQVHNEKLRREVKSHSNG